MQSQLLRKVRFMKIKNNHYISESNDDVFLPTQKKGSGTLSIPKCPWEIYILGKWNNCPQNWKCEHKIYVENIWNLNIMNKHPSQDIFMPFISYNISVPALMHNPYITSQ